MFRLAIILTLLTVLPAVAKPHATLKGHKATVAAVAFSPDGKLLASGAWDRTIRIWNVASGKLIGQLTGHQDWVRALRFQTNTTLISACERQIRTWNVPKLAVGKTVSLPRLQVTSMTMGRAGKRLIIGTRDGRVWLWQQGVNKPITRKVHSMAVTAVAMQHQGYRFAAGSSRGHLKIGSTKTNKLVTLAGHDGSKIFALSFSPDDKSVASGAFDTTIRIWDVASGVNKGILRGHRGLVMSLRYGHEGGRIISGGRHGNVYLWNLGSRKPEKTLSAHPGNLGFSVLALDMSADGKWIATGAYDHLVKLWKRE